MKVALPTIQNPSCRCTVATMQTNNPHVGALPQIFLKDCEKEISELELRAHTVVLGILTAGIPASTIPAIYKNSSYGGTGLVFGFGLGLLLSYLSLNPNTSLTNFQHWAERVAAMNNTTKASGATGYGLVISGNTLANLFAPISNPTLSNPIVPIYNCTEISPLVILSTCSTNGNNLYALFQGVVAGAIAGKFLGTGIMNSLTDILKKSNGTSTTLTENTTDSLITNNPTEENIHDPVENPQTAINI